MPACQFEAPRFATISLPNTTARSVVPCSKTAAPRRPAKRDRPMTVECAALIATPPSRNPWKRASIKVTSLPRSTSTPQRPWLKAPPATVTCDESTMRRRKRGASPAGRSSVAPRSRRRLERRIVTGTSTRNTGVVTRTAVIDRSASTVLRREAVVPENVCTAAGDRSASRSRAACNVVLDSAQARVAESGLRPSARARAPTCSAPARRAPDRGSRATGEGGVSPAGRARRVPLAAPRPSRVLPMRRWRRAAR